LANDLNLGLDSVVYVDDNPAERHRVGEALPQVFVPEWPQDKRLYPAALLALDCFDLCTVTPEDRQRAQMYANENQRAAFKLEAGSLQTWLESLDTHVLIEELSEVNRARAVQLFNKTNQMNLSTRRLTETELLAWIASEGRTLWTFRVNDRFGDSGLVAILS